jgi:hypothetical protein
MCTHRSTSRCGPGCLHTNSLSKLLVFDDAAGKISVKQWNKIETSSCCEFE